ncbi:hypothetical protein [Actinomadura sp. NPDC048394]|uniref:hypothetical protein n=1 Tax=Actinomadura sp. NPDC048394 TaxID=3158223 RepID=UPI0033E61474
MPGSPAEARALAGRFRTAPGIPVVLPLDMAGDLSVLGRRGNAPRLLRAMVAQLAAFHALDDAPVAHVGERAADFNWLKWLP